ncbi:MAG: GNAT family N-acetyltransferase [Planctomycetaceae bacterium]|nr:MAG: GNAT family N-acetyltransferase [Planctomycetaceae bacterium]
MNAPPTPEIVIRLADLQHPDDGRRIVELLDMYAREPVGQSAPLAEDVCQRLVSGLRDHPTTLVLLAMEDQNAVGIAVCFLGYSTFAARPLLNIHDLAVHPESRGRGVGRSLLQAVQQQAAERGCCKMTLEVREDNHGARRLYRDFGFESENGAPYSHSFWAKKL